MNKIKHFARSVFSILSLERVSYIAQCATIVSFFFAVYFSYLTWQEARLAREDQSKYFIEEKSPDMSILRVTGSMSYGENAGVIIRVKMKNNGSSTARKISIKMDALEEDLDAGPFVPLESSNFFHRTLPRGREIDVIMFYVKLGDRKYNWKANTISLYPLDDQNEGTELIAKGLLKYYGQFGDEHSEEFYIAAERN